MEILQNATADHDSFFLSIAEALPGAVILVNDTNKVLYRNEYFRNFFNNRIFPGSLFDFEGDSPIARCIGNLINTVKVSGLPATASFPAHGWDSEINTIIPLSQITIQVVSLKYRKPPAYLVCISEEIDHEKHEILESSFFHDVIHSIGELRKVLNHMNNAVHEDNKLKLLFPQGKRLVEKLLEEIEVYRHLSTAGSGRFIPAVMPVSSSEIYDKVREKFISNNGGLPGSIVQKNITFTMDFGKFVIPTDEMILMKALSGLLELSGNTAHPGSNIALKAYMKDSRAIFTVESNQPDSLPDDYSIQVLRLFISDFLNGHLSVLSLESGHAPGETHRIVMSIPCLPIS